MHRDFAWCASVAMFWAIVPLNSIPRRDFVLRAFLGSSWFESAYALESDSKSNRQYLRHSRWSHLMKTGTQTATAIIFPIVHLGC